MVLTNLWVPGYVQGRLLLAHAASVSLEPIRLDQVNHNTETDMCRRKLFAPHTLHASFAA